jgi:hypothetical protein
MTEQIHRTKINKSNIWLVYLRSVFLFCHSTCLSSLCVFVLSFDLFIFALCIWSVSRLVYLRSVYLICHSTCLSSLCVFVLSFDLFIFAMCICSVIWLVYLRSVYLVCQSTCLSSLCVFSQDKQVKWQTKYTERR